MTESELRAFLLERAKEGYSFPVNPVWPVRDKGWLEVLTNPNPNRDPNPDPNPNPNANPNPNPNPYQVLTALQQNEEAAQNVRSWFPPSSGPLERIQQLHDNPNPNPNTNTNTNTNANTNTNPNPNPNPNQVCSSGSSSCTSRVPTGG